MATFADPLRSRIRSIPTTDLEELHPSRIEDHGEIYALLETIMRDEIPLRRGMNRQIVPEIARIKDMTSSEVRLETENFEESAIPQVFLSFSREGEEFFFSARLISHLRDGAMRIAFPSAIYGSERRDRFRSRPDGPTPVRVGLMASANQGRIEADVSDWSAQGISVVIRESEASALPARVRLRHLSGARSGEELFGEIRNRRPYLNRDGWVQIGLELSSAPRGAPVRVETAQETASRSVLRGAWTRLQMARAGVQLAADRIRGVAGLGVRELPEVRVVEFQNRTGEHIRAIIDSCGMTPGAPAVVIPPAWGRTKETLMPLALLMVAAFRRAKEPVVVVRLDGIRKRGESYNDPECRAPGKDHHKFSFSQGVRDIQATLDFLETSAEFKTSRAILVSFSAAAVEARRAAAIDGRIKGWVSVVGAPDVQSMMRVISGGIDYAYGLERGIRFGLQEVLGIEVDMDFAGIDAQRKHMTFLEDARRDMAAIRIPITWIRGRYDAWMDDARVDDILCRGDSTNRRLIEVPTGHMLKSSREALTTFQIVVGEVSRMALGREIKTPVVDAVLLDRRRKAERQRLPRERGDLRAFWRDYLVGRDATLGMELMTSVSAYEQLMRAQVNALSLQRGDYVVDFGSGTGAFPLFLAESVVVDDVNVIELDYVREALERTRQRLGERGDAGELRVTYVDCHLEMGGNRRFVPLRSEGVDAVLASLFLSYVSDPEAALTEMYRILKPGGRLVVSSLRRDADMSKLYVEGAEELRAGRARLRFGEGVEATLDRALRQYLNEASRLLDLEEQGIFRFWDIEELERLVLRAGFSRLTRQECFGSPPQAVVVSGVRL